MNSFPLYDNLKKDLPKEEINIQPPNQKQRLIELKNLFDKGLITKEIYGEKQRKILNGNQ